MSESPAETLGQVLWQDRVARFSLGLALALNLLLFAVVLIASGRIDEAIASASAAAGNPPANALILPVIGLFSWVIGAILGYLYYFVREEAPMAYIIWGAVVLIELATWLPVLTLIIGL